MYLMMQHSEPDDWVLSTGETHSVREFAEKAFNLVGLNWEDYVVTSKKYERPNEVNHLLGDSSKAREKLKWKPELTFDGLVELMVNSDIKLAEKEKMLVENQLLVPTWEFSKKV